MMRYWIKVMVGALVVAGASGGLAAPALAAGYAQGLQGARSAGLSGAVTARPDMGAAGYYNPAGLVLDEGLSLDVGASALVPRVIYEDPETGERTAAQVNGAFPPYLHGRLGFEHWAVGLSFGVPYGSGLSWPQDWTGRYEVTATSLTVMEAAPSVAWRPVDWLAIGGGPRLAYGTVGIERALDFAQPDSSGSVDLSGQAFGLGGQAGLWAQVHDRWQVGASWRSAVALAMEGVARFEDVPQEMADRAHDTRAQTEMVMPHRLALGVAYEVGLSGVISVDLEYQLWGAVDRFEVDFESDGVDDISEPRDWENTLTMRLGAEYQLPLNGLSVRTGFAIDPSPAPASTLSPATPDTDRFITSLGLGYEATEFLDVNLAYRFITLSRTASDGDFPGVYDGQIHGFSLGVAARVW